MTGWKASGKPEMTRPLVGIDLAPASLTTSAPGTAKHVTELAKELALLDVPWDWLPTVESTENALFRCFPKYPAKVVANPGFARRAWWDLGKAWSQAGCQLGYASTCFIPCFGPPVVANLFDSNIYEHGDTWIQSGKRKSYWINRLASDHAIWRAKKLFILSDYCRNYLGERFPRQMDKMVTIPCGLPIFPAPCAQKPAWAKDLDRPFFVYVGTFSENKNQRRLLEAWEVLQTTIPEPPALVLVGPCPADFRSHIDPVLKRLRFPAQVILTGRISGEEVSWAYTNAYAAVQPSIAEGFGLPIIEAMSFGLPVACSNTTSLPETAGGAAHLFNPFDPSDIARAVTKLWTDKGLCEKLARLGKDRSLQFSWRRTAEMTRAAIAEELSKLHLI